MLRLRNGTRVVAGVVALAVAALAPAQTHSSAVPGSAAKAAPDYSKEAYVIERLATEAVFQSDGTGRREQTLSVRVQSAEGVRQFGVITAPYDASNERVERIEIRVRKPDGTLVTTPESNIQDLPNEVSRAAPMYSDLREKQIPVKSLGAGDLLESHIVWIRAKAEVPGQFWFGYRFVEGAVVLDEQVRVDVPGDKYVQVRSPECTPAISERDGRKAYLWKYSQLEPSGARKKPEPKRQRVEPELPAIQLTTFRDWAELGKWFGALIEKQAAVTPAIREKATELTKSLSTDAEKQHALYDFVATKFRYISISFGAGHFQPHSAEEVFTNQYGDCKDKHTLLAALMKAAGFTVWPVLINVGSKLDPEMPSPAQFNHLITFLPEGEKMVWLDTTPEVAPWGVLLGALRDRQALLIPADGPARLVTTPADLPFPTREELSVTGALSDDGTLTGHIDLTMRGDAEVIYRAIFRHTPPANWQQLVQNLSRSMGFAGTTSEAEVDEIENTAKPFHYSWNYERKKYPDWENHRIIAPIPAVPMPFGEGDSKPSEPIELGSPGEFVHRAVVRLPKGYAAVPNEDVKVDNAVGAYASHAEFTDGTLRVQHSVRIKQSKAPVSEWDDYLAIVKGIRTDVERWIQITNSQTHTPPPSDAAAAEFTRKGWAALQSHNLAAAREAFEQAEKVNPKEPGLQTAIGYMLASENRREEAIERYRRAIEINPDDLPAAGLLAEELMRAGRRKEAAEVLRRRAENAPTDPLGVAAFADVMLVLKRGQEALPAVQTALKAHPEHLGLQLLQIKILINSNNPEAGVTLARKLCDESNNSGVLNDVAYALAETGTDLPLALKYAERAVSLLESDLKEVALNTLKNEDLRRLIKLAAAWDTVGWTHFRMGGAPKAQVWVNASWMLGARAAVADHLGQIYEEQRNPDAAIHMYELALAVDPKLDEARGRLKNLAGTPPLPKPAPLRNLMNGRAVPPNVPVSRAEELGKLRTFSIPELGTRVGSAEFFILFSAQKVEDAQFISGSQQLTDAVYVMKKKRFPVPFPDAGPERIVRRGILSCSKYMTPSCALTFLTLESTRK